MNHKDIENKMKEKLVEKIIDSLTGFRIKELSPEEQFDILETLIEIPKENIEENIQQESTEQQPQDEFSKEFTGVLSKVFSKFKRKKLENKE